MIKRTQIAALTLSAAALVGIAVHEGYRSEAYIPTPGDRPTVGFGSTFKEDGKPVQLGERTDPVSALKRTQLHIAKDELGLKRCLTADLYQHEYDTLVDFAYQYGVAATCSSSMVRLSNVGRYADACEGYTRYRFSQKRDCSLPEHWGPRGCKGVWLRNLERRNKCLGL